MKSPALPRYVGTPVRQTARLAKDIAKKVRTFLIYALRAYKRRKQIYYIFFWRHAPIRRKTVFWESFYGRGMLDNPCALFRAMLDNPAYADYRHVWVLDNPAYHAGLIRAYAKHRNVRFVAFQSYAYLRALATSETVVNNVTFWAYFIKRAGQTYVNTWHGIPLKTIGADDNRLESTNMVRNFLQADILLSANAFLTSVYRQSFCLGSLFRGEIVEEGYPRLDTLVSDDRQTTLQALRDHGVALSDDRAIILYAPTWRGVYERPEVGLDEALRVKACIEAAVDTCRYQVLIKPHQVVYAAARKRFDRLGCVIPATFDANAVLAVTDVLISDYSSIFFDFLQTGRPILFYLPDLAQYAKARGLYMTPDELPGPVFETPEALAEGLADLPESIRGHREKYERMRDWSSFGKPGGISERILAHLFGGAPARLAEPEKKKTTLVFFADLLRVNGITSSFVNLLNALDYDRYDVTVLTNYDPQGNLRRTIGKINPKVRLLSRKNVYGRTFFDELRLHLYVNRGLDSRIGRWAFPEQYLREECIRYFGRAEFDCAIDFVGYAILYMSLASVCKAKRHLVWAHSDVCAEQRTRMGWLVKVFGLYPRFDALVSVSESLREKNRQALSARGVEAAFLACPNIIFAERILEGMAGSRVFEEEGRPYLLAGRLADTLTSLKAIPLFLRDTDGGCVPHPMRFVMVGRLSPEKNHAATLRAFAGFLKTNAAAMLYIVGDGPLQKPLRRLVAQLGVGKNVVFAGLLENPAELMAQCDCFVLTSLYEGQPMVVHEARVAHLPIILSTFHSCRDVCVENGQYLVQPDEASIQEGFRAFSEGRVPRDYVYDHHAYNQDVLKRFDLLVGGGPTPE